MATKTYDEYEVDQLIKSQKQSDDYAAQRKAQADEAAKTSDGVYDAALETAQRNAEASKKATESGYRQMYDANAVQELVARRNVEEAMANMGLTDSGLNRTQQTAISLQRGRADYQTSQQKQSAIDAIMRELDNYRTQNNAEKTAASRDIYAQADADILNYRQNADAAARQNAASLYAADQERAAAEYAAQQEAAEKQAQYNLDMLKLGYVYDETAGGYVKQAEETGATDQLTNDQIKLVLEYMDKTGEDYNTAAKMLFGTGDAPVTGDDDPWKTGQFFTVSTPAMYAFEYSLHSESEHDAVMRNMYGSYNQYRAQMLKNSKLSESEMIALIQKWGLVESDFNAKR